MKCTRIVAPVSCINNINSRNWGYGAPEASDNIKQCLKWENVNINDHKCVIMNIIITIFWFKILREETCLPVVTVVSPWCAI